MNPKIKARLSQLSSHLLSEDPNNNNMNIPTPTLVLQSNKLASERKRKLEGEVAIITGSGQGIGEQCALQFAEHGAKIVVTDLDAKKAEIVAQKIVSNGGEALAVAGDITDAKFPETLVAKTIEKYGKLNHIVNNAGYTWDGVIHKMSDKQWEAMLVMHNTAPFRLIRAAAPYMRDAGKTEIERDGKPQNRSIINISSTSGLHGNFGQANYSTAKMGLLGLTKTVAKEWGAFGIRSNAVAFGFIQTRLTAAKNEDNFIEVEGKKIALGIPSGTRSFDAIPLKRPGNAEEAAGGVLLLALPEASYITGHCLEVTGGAGI